MNNCTDFRPKAERNAAEQLDAFINWAKLALPKGIPGRLHESIRWDMDSWNSVGVKGATFTSIESTRRKRVDMQSPFIDFARAIAVYNRLYLGNISSRSWIDSLKALEAALVELTGKTDVTRISPVVCNRATEIMRNKWRAGDCAYNFSKSLEKIVKLMIEKGLLSKPFRWTSPLKRNSQVALKQQKENRVKKLPSRESLQALGELFNNELTDPLDIVITSSCALLLSQPSRIGELVDLEHDCIVFKEESKSDKRMFLRWYAEKGFGATLKPVVKGMEPVVRRAVDRLLPITNEARNYAAWLEDHPDDFPPHPGLPNKGVDEPLTYTEACSALKVRPSETRTPRSLFKGVIDNLSKRNSLGPAARVILDELHGGWVSGKLKRKSGDKGIVTLRKLNVLVREKYLPKYFPYTSAPEDGKKRVKYRDALFTVRTGALVGEKAVGKLTDFGVDIAAKTTRLVPQLGGATHTNNIFHRHGYKGVRVNSHAFRHELNTEMHRAGLSQLLIDAFSGRTAMGSVYNHETVEERTQAVAEVHPKTKQGNATTRLEKIRANTPLSLSDVRKLAESDQDRIIHQTHVGICVHNFASEPCPKMGACLRCGKLACIKGEEEKLKNIKEERDYLQKRYRAAMDAESRGEIGSELWVQTVRKDLLKCEALIKLLEDPELEDGDIVWNTDDGWNLTNNAAVMAGLIDPQVIEDKKQEVLPSLDELAVDGEIEV